MEIMQLATTHKTSGAIQLPLRCRFVISIVGDRHLHTADTPSCDISGQLLTEVVPLDYGLLSVDTVRILRETKG